MGERLIVKVRLGIRVKISVIFLDGFEKLSSDDVALSRSETVSRVALLQLVDDPTIDRLTADSALHSDHLKSHL